jgi:NitT/TauT family transport system permease protein
MSAENPGLVWLLRALVGGGFLGVWQWGANSGWLDPFFFSRPTHIATRVVEWVTSGSLWPHLGTTLLEALLAFVIGSLLGVSFGFTLGRLPLAARVLDPYIKIANALPRVALAPLFLLWFGLDIRSKVALGVTLVFFLVFFNTYRGVLEVNPVLVNNARMLGANEAQLIRHVLLPSVLTWIFSSLEAAVGFAIVGAVVGEYLGAARGVGYLIAQAEGVFDTTGVFAGMAVLAAIVLVVSYGVGRVERYLLRWKKA